MKTTSYALAGALAMSMGSASAWAQCTTAGNVNNLIPFARGTAVNSIITTLSAVNTASLGQTTAFVGTPGGAAPGQMGGGSWSRVIAGTVETESTTVTTATSPFVGTDSCKVTTKQDFIGTQTGMDISRLNFAGGGNMHFGVTAGYFEVDAKDKTPGQGSFSSDTQIPFAGLYMAINAGKVSFDAQLRGDFYHSELNDVTQGVFNQSLDAKSAAFLWNASYQFDLRNNWFIRPSIGGVWSRTEIDDLSVAGSFLLAASVTPAQTLPGTVSIDPVTSLVGRASLTTGTTFVSGRYAIQPFATVSGFHEFAGDVTANMTGDIGALTNGNQVGTLAATSRTSRVGSYLHLGAGVAGTIIDTGWLGYVKMDYLTGDHIDAFSVNAGLRYQFTPSKQFAGLKDDGPVYDDGVNWSGLYAGWHSGGMQGKGDWQDAQGPTSARFSGFVGGGQIGYNIQTRHLVLGIEGDIAYANAEGGRACPGAGPDAFFFACEVDVNALGTLTGKIGVAKERALFYVKGGLAVADVTARTQYNLGNNALAFPPFPGGANGVRSDSATMTGWAVGAGMEFAINETWSVKGEYLHFDLGSKTFQTFDAGPGAVFPADVDVKGDTVRIGINYHFGNRGEAAYHEPVK